MRGLCAVGVRCGVWVWPRALGLRGPGGSADRHRERDGETRHTAARSRAKYSLSENGDRSGSVAGVFDLKFGVNETCPKYKTLEMAQLEVSGA